MSLIHEGDWKLLEYLEDGRLELYNLRDDIGESKNLASTQPERAKAMYAKLVAWRESVKAPMPTPNKGDGAPATAKKKKGGKKAKEKEKV